MIVNMKRTIDRRKRLELLNKRKKIALEIESLLKEYAKYTDPDYRVKHTRPQNIAVQFGQLRTLILRTIMDLRVKTKSTRSYVFHAKRIAKPKRILRNLRRLEKIGG